ncbi:MAG: hypothetical protein ACLFPW_02285 [Spirochaetaceae bacterium]
MRAFTLLTLLVLLVSAELPSQEQWRWPLEEGEVVENYSGNRPFPTERRGETAVIHGMRLASEAREVFPVGPGEPIYLAEPSRGGVNEVISPLGGTIALRHAGGLRSIYGHIEPQSPFGADPARPLGGLNGRGAQLGRSLFLSLYDEREGQSLNPRLVLPERTDRYRPVVAELQLYAAGGRELIWSSRSGEGVVREGTVTLVALVYDRESPNDRYAPYRVTIFANGAQVADYTLDARSVWRNLPVARDGGQTALRVAATNVTLVDGSNTIEVVAEDFRGNLEERVFELDRRVR